MNPGGRRQIRRARAFGRLRQSLTEAYTQLFLGEIGDLAVEARKVEDLTVPTPGMLHRVRPPLEPLGKMTGLFSFPDYPLGPLIREHYGDEDMAVERALAELEDLP